MDKQRGEVDLSTVHLGLLTFEAHNLLSCLLNTPKTLLSEGPEKLPRDWRGLARLINISSEIANSYDTDKTSKVINYWKQKNDGTATIGKLLEYVQKIDRYDIFDDFMELSEKGVLFDNQPRRTRPTQRNNVVAIPGYNQLMLYPDPDPIDEDIITYEDKLKGCPQFYNAYVMYALQDKDFVDEMLNRMEERGYKMCTEDNLLPDHTTTFAPVSRLISSDRCHRIVLVYSPDFLTCPANNFYMDYAQAVGIEMKKPKIIPCMYRPCTLPPQMSFYHKLWYNAPGSKSTYDFWDRLAMALEVRTNNSPPRITYPNGLNSTSSLSTLNITELTSTSQLTNGMLRPGLLALPSPPTKSASIQGLDTYSDDSQSTISIGSKSPKKKGKKFMNLLNLSGLLPTNKKKKEFKMPV